MADTAGSQKEDANVGKSHYGHTYQSNTVDRTNSTKNGETGQKGTLW